MSFSRSTQWRGRTRSGRWLAALALTLIAAAPTNAQTTPLTVLGLAQLFGQEPQCREDQPSVQQARGPLAQVAQPRLPQTCPQACQELRVLPRVLAGGVLPPSWCPPTPNALNEETQRVFEFLIGLFDDGPEELPVPAVVRQLGCPCDSGRGPACTNPGVTRSSAGGPSGSCQECGHDNSLACACVNETSVQAKPKAGNCCCAQAKTCACTTSCACAKDCCATGCCATCCAKATAKACACATAKACAKGCACAKQAACACATTCACSQTCNCAKAAAAKKKAARCACDTGCACCQCGTPKTVHAHPVSRECPILRGGMMHTCPLGHLPMIPGVPGAAPHGHVIAVSPPTHVMLPPGMSLPPTAGLPPLPPLPPMVNVGMGFALRHGPTPAIRVAKLGDHASGPNVHVLIDGMEIHCQRLTCSGANIVLEGEVRVCLDFFGKSLQVRGERVLVNAHDGGIRVESMGNMPAAVTSVPPSSGAQCGTTLTTPPLPPRYAPPVYGTPTTSSPLCIPGAVPSMPPADATPVTKPVAPRSDDAQSMRQPSRSGDKPVHERVWNWNDEQGLWILP